MTARFRHLVGSSVVLLSSLSIHDFMRGDLLQASNLIYIFLYQYILTCVTGALLSNLLYIPILGPLLRYTPPPYEYENTIRNPQSTR